MLLDPEVVVAASMSDIASTPGVWRKLWGLTDVDVDLEMPGILETADAPCACFALARVMRLGLARRLERTYPPVPCSAKTANLWSLPPRNPEP